MRDSSQSTKGPTTRYNENGVCKLCGMNCKVMVMPMNCATCNIPIEFYLKKIENRLFGISVRC